MKQLSALLFAFTLFVVNTDHVQAQGCTNGAGPNLVGPGPAWATPIYPWSPGAAPFGSYAATNAPNGPGAIMTLCSPANYKKNCESCPASWSVTLTGTQYKIPMYMCFGNQYTITTCGSPTASSAITVSTATSVILEFDANSCGTHATVNFTPQTSGSYFININAAFALCPVGIPGTVVQITCGQAACPSAGDDPCPTTPPLPCNQFFTPCPAIPGAVAFTGLGPTCTTLPGSTAGASGTSGISVSPVCGGYPAGGDVWFSANASPTGTLALDVDHINATDLAMTLYTSTTGCVTGGFTEVPGACNGDLIPGVDRSPFISMSGLTPNALYYIRVWPSNNITNGGTFTLCAYYPVPPINDSPCTPTTLIATNPGCVPVSFNTQDATNSVIPNPGCSTANNDVWFRLTVPSTGTLNINTLAGSLTNMAMAVYSPCVLPGSAPGCSTGSCASLILLQCQNGGVGMPTFTPSVYFAGQVLYVRMWSETTGFGTFQICAYMSQPPPNDEPCGAIALASPVPYGCLMRGITTGLATPTGGAIPGVAVGCGGPADTDVWYTAVVPPNGELRLDMDDAQMTDAAAAIYTTSINNNCASVFTQVGCWAAGSTNSGMPAGTVTGLTPGNTVFIRVWHQSTGVPGNAFLCVSRTDTPPFVPPSACYFTLSMFDSGGDGWNGGYVRITVAGVPTNYTIVSANGTVSFPVANGAAFQVDYFPLGGFQNQISYSLQSNLGLLIYSSPPGGPTPGFNASGSADCNAPPPNPADCLSAFRICSSSSVLAGAPANSGAVADLNSGNDGCLAGESVGLWYSFTAAAAGNLAFTISPGGYADYDFAVWGPYSGIPSCPNGPLGTPLRCSWAAGGGPTGLNMTSGDLSEGAGGDRFVQFLNAPLGAQYILYVDNWSRNAINFTMTFTGPVGCTVLPVQMLDFDGRPIDKHVELDWATGSEVNSSHFIVERSVDGINFEAIGRVSAAGTSLDRTDYKFIDRAPKDGMNYYRLEQVDIDGSSYISRTVNVHFQTTTSLFVFPNPATETLNASLGKAIEGTVRWRILDMSGRQVGEGSLTNSEGTTRFTVPVGKLESGSYALEVLEGKGVPIGNVRFVKQ